MEISLRYHKIIEALKIVIIFFIAAITATTAIAQMPTIASFSPANGPVGTTVTITGANFDLTPANNIAKFNGTIALITASTPTSITTTVPVGATAGNITVTVAGLTGTSVTLFTVDSAPWVQTNGPYGGGINTMAADGGNLFAGTYSGGVFRSTNNGSTWTQITNRSVESLTFTGGNLFAGISGGVLRSTDNGANWTELNTGLTGLLVVSLAMSGGNLFAGTNSGGVFRSADDGNNWTEVNTGLTNLNVVSLAMSGGNLFAGTYSGGVFRSADDGNTWTEVNAGLTNLQVQSLVISGGNLFAGTGGSGVFRSADDGNTWTEVNAGLTNLQVLSLVISGGNLFAGTGGSGVFRSADDGDTWTEANTGLTNLRVPSLAISGGNLFAGTDWSGVFRSADNGGTWTEVNTGIIITRIFSLASSGGTVFAGNFGRVFRSTDNGTSWMGRTIVNEGLITSFIFSGGNVFAGSEFNGVFRSANNGDTWTAVNSGLTNFQILSLTNIGNNLFAGTFGGVFRSTDNGASWTAVNTGLITLNIFSLANSGGNLFAGTGSGVFRSSNNGDTWTAVNTGLTNLFVQSITINGGNLFASLNSGGVFRSSDNGDTWTGANSGLPINSVRSFTVNGGNLFACTGSQGGVFCSTDNGGTWTAVNAGLTFEFVYTLAVSAGNMFAGTDNGIFIRPLSEFSKPPSVTSFTPNLGSIATTVTITGLNFSPVAANNLVEFNGTIATVVGSTPTSITTTVPTGATTGPLSVTVAGNTAFSVTEFTVTTGSCIPAIERAALIALYNSTNGAGWINNTNWLSADESTWYGVTVQSCRVVSIFLNNNNLVGTLPTELGDLTQLTILNLGQSGFATNKNKISGTVPSSVANLVNLKTLWLSVNQLSGSLPAFIGSLNNLEYLDFGDNQFTGNIPNSWFSLPVIEVLDLSKNNLSGNLSSQIGQLTTLKYFNLGTNQFSGSLPSELGNLTLLNTLTLDANQFSGTVPASFGNLINMLFFGLSVNQLSGDLPASLGNWTNLVTFVISLNQFTGDLPPAIGNFPNLFTVNVRGNQFISIPKFTSIDLVDFRVFGNRLNFGHLEPNIGTAGFQYSPQANLPGGTAFTCAGSTLTINFSTPGTANSYQWYKEGVLISGATSATFTKNNAVAADAGNYTVQVTNSIVIGLTLQSDNFLVTVNMLPVLPTATGASACGNSTITLNASGGTNGQYRWYTVATGGTAVTTQTNSSYTTPSLTTTTTYYVSINNGTCESARTPVVAAINAPPAQPIITGASGCSPSAIILNASGGTSGQYRWYTVATGGTALTGQTNSSYTTPSLTTTTTYYVSINNGTCESARTLVIATITGLCAQPPVINTAPLSTTVGGIVTIDLKPLITTSGTLDINSIQLTVPPSSGAIGTISNGVLTISYQGIAFTGKEIFSIRACDNNGNCSTQQFEIEVAGDVVVYNALSPNGANPVFTIEYIELIPETKNNSVTIFDRWQNEVWSASNYNNSSVVFKGVSNSGSDLPTGIYFYKIEFASGKKMQTGFISLKR